MTIAYTSHGRQGGMTLVEVVISIGLCAVLSVALITAALAAARLAHNIPYELHATQLLNRVAEELRKENYPDVGTESLPQYNSPMTFEYDPQNPSAGPVFTITCEFKGFGMARGSGAANLRIDLAEGEAGWEKHEWRGQYVMLKSGSGAGQIALIKGNTPDRLRITRDLYDRRNQIDWIQQPDSTTYFEIGGGKTVVLTAAWSVNGKNYQKSITTMLLN